jgi:hypothetical protein
VTIQFTQIPGSGEGEASQGQIAGTVLNLSDPAKYRIVIYAHTDFWYVQPLVKHPYTPIKRDGRWSNWTHLGSRYAALVVARSYQPPAKVQALPEEGGDILAIEEVPAARAKQVADEQIRPPMKR